MNCPACKEEFTNNLQIFNKMKYVELHCINKNCFTRVKFSGYKAPGIVIEKSTGESIDYGLFYEIEDTYYFVRGNTSLNIFECTYLSGKGFKLLTSVPNVILKENDSLEEKIFPIIESIIKMRAFI